MEVTKQVKCELVQVVFNLREGRITAQFEPQMDGLPAVDITDFLDAGVQGFGAVYAELAFKWTGTPREMGVAAWEQMMGAYRTVRVEREARAAAILKTGEARDEQ